MELRRQLRVRGIMLLATALQVVAAVFGVSILLSAAPTSAVQSVPYMINFQGRLTDNNGNILSDGSYNVKFRLWTLSSGGTNQWEDDRVFGASDHRITVQNGLFNIQFGDTTQGDPALSPTLFDGSSTLYLEVEMPTPATATCASNACAVWTEGAMTPRQPLASSPYAFNSDTLDGLDSSAFAQLTSTNTFTAANLFAPTTTSTVALTVAASTAGGSDALDVKDSGGALQASFDASGNLNVAQSIQPTSNGAVGLGTPSLAFGSLYTQNIDTGTSGTTLTVGGANATTITIGGSALTQALNAGSLASGSVTALTGDGITETLASGGVLIQPSADNVNVFQVVNAAGSPMFNVDTTDTNLITGLDPGFEANPINSWAIKGAGSTITRTTAQHYTGNAAGLMTTPTSANNGIQLPYTFTNGNIYDFSFYAMLASGTMTTLVVGHQDTSGTNVNCLTAQTVLTTGWTRYSCSFTAGAPTGSNLYIYDSSAVGHTLYVDGFQLLPGNAAGVYGGGNLQLNSTITSPLAIQNPTNSTTEFSVANAAGATILNVDTLGGKINLGTSAAITTAGALSGLTGTSQSSGTAVFKTSSNVNAFQVQNASGWQLLDIDSTFPATNLITNPGFETNTTGWANKAGGALTRITTPTTALYYGVAAGNLALTAANGGTSFAKALTLGTTYNLSFYARASSGTVSNISFGYTNTGGDQDCATNQTVVSTGFTRFTCSFTVTGTAGTAIYVKQSSLATETIYIDGFQLLSGVSAPQPYSLGNVAIRATITSPQSFQNTNDSTTAFQIQNAAGTSNLFVADTLNGRVGIGTANPQSLLDVSGTVNATGYSAAGTAGQSSTVSCSAGQAVTAAVFSSGLLTTAPTCAAVGGGSNVATDLSNLTATSINQSLIANANNSLDVGSTTNVWKDVFTGNVDAGTTTTALTVGTAATTTAVTIGRSGLAVSLPGGLTTSGGAVNAGAGTISGGQHSGTNGVFTNNTSALLLGTTNTAQFNVTGAGAQTFSFGTGGTVCTTTASTCSGVYQVAGSYQAAGSYLVQAPAGTANTITAASGAQALIIKGTNGTGADLVDIYNTAISPVLVSKFDQNGAFTTTATIVAPTSGNTINGLIINAGALNGVTTITTTGAINGATISGGALSGSAVNGLSVSAGTITSPTITGTITGSSSPTITGFGSISGTALSGSSSVTSPSFTGAGAVSVTSGAASGLTLDSTNGTLVFGANTTTLQKAANALAIDLATAGTSTLTVKNSNGANVANLTVTGTISAPTINATTTLQVGGSPISSSNLSDSTSITKQGNGFNGASQLVQLNASTQLPAVSGNLLTSLNPTNLTTGSGAVTLQPAAASALNLTSTGASAITITPGTNGLAENFAASVTETQTATAAMTADLFDQTNTSATNAPTADGINLFQQTFFAKPSGTNMESATRINVTNSNTGAGGQVQGLRIAVTGAGGAIASDTDGIFIDNYTNASSGSANENALEVGTGWDAGFYVQSGGNTIKATSTTALQVESAGSLAALSVDTSANVVLIGSATTDTNQINLQLDSASAFADSGTCSTTINQGAMYYNTNTNAIRSCTNGGWEDVVTTAGLGIMLFGVVPDSGSNPGDLIAAGATAHTTGPCKVSWKQNASASQSAQVNVAPCVAYSGGRKVVVSSTTAVTLNGTVGSQWEHLCFTTAGALPATLAAGTNVETNTANNPNASYLTTHEGAPILCLADILMTSGTGTTAAVNNIWDVRTFTTSTKEYSLSGAAMALGVPAMTNGAATTITNTSTTTGQSIEGVVVATDMSTSTTAPNIILSVAGPTYAKTIVTAGSVVLGDIINNSATAARVQATTTPNISTATNYYALLGIARTTLPATACLSTPSAADCDYGVYFEQQRR